MKETGKEPLYLQLDKRIVAALRKAALANKRKLNAQVEFMLEPLLKEGK